MYYIGICHYPQYSYICTSLDDVNIIFFVCEHTHTYCLHVHMSPLSLLFIVTLCVLCIGSINVALKGGGGGEEGNVLSVYIPTTFLVLSCVTIVTLLLL